MEKKAENHSGSKNSRKRELFKASDIPFSTTKYNTVLSPVIASFAEVLRESKKEKADTFA